MKSELDNEIDRLLRAEARRSGELRATEREVLEPSVRTAASTHLDADALSLYMEKALPPPALMNHTQHLVECDACRAQLATLARMVASEPEAQQFVHTLAEDQSPLAPPVNVNAADKPSRAAWWTRLADILFAPQNLAYALPVLTLFIIGIALFLFTALPKRESSTLVAEKTQPVTGTYGNAAMNMNANMSPPEAPESSQESVTTATTNPNVIAQKSETTPATQRGAENVKQNQPLVRPSAAPALPDANQLAGAVAARDSLRRETPANQNVASLPVNGRAAVVVALAPPPPEVRQQGKAKTTDDARAEIVGVATDDEVVATTSPRSASANMNTANAPAVARREESLNQSRTIPARRARRNDGFLNRDGVAGAREEKATVESVTRTVGNRRFTRRGTTWIDDNYKERTAVTNVRRGSEQFRALVADEPDLRQVAEKLPGEVIVVRKNRAYRFQ